ncbi:MAG: hypothetical protein JXJ04_22010 [Spirochaetales bacterium]|nr:hypothetical protein [Spirochaetales bacterium]
MTELKLNQRIIFHGLTGLGIGFIVYYPVSVLLYHFVSTLPGLHIDVLLTFFYTKYLPMAFYFSGLGLIFGIIHGYYIHGMIKKDNKRVAGEEYLVICSHCKKIKVSGIQKGDSHWIDCGVSLSGIPGKTLSHGICPECAAALYPELIEKVLSP